jgi:hypothetical protein
VLTLKYPNRHPIWTMCPLCAEDEDTLQRTATSVPTRAAAPR